MEIIAKYFPEITTEQREKFAALADLYASWNARINVISRKDIDELYTRHVLHSLAIAKWVTFKPEAKILDVGTGGGFPGIPLAILFPQTSFFLIDSIGKKTTVVQAVAEALELKNVKSAQMRAENVKQHFDFVVTRAVAPLPTLVQWTKGKLVKKGSHTLANGILALKGGDLAEELGSYRAQIFNLSDVFSEPFFETKKLVHLPATEMRKS